jgi:hypothetical protein
LKVPRWVRIERNKMADTVTRGQVMEMAAGIGPYVTKTITFAGGTLNGIGDINGTSNPLTLFTVTGTVALKLFATVGTDLAGATAKLEIGTALSTAGLIAQSTCTDIDANEIWHDATPDASVELWTVATEKIVRQNVIATASVADITGGVLTFHCIWRPISNDGKVVAA